MPEAGARPLASGDVKSSTWDADTDTGKYITEAKNRRKIACGL